MERELPILNVQDVSVGFSKWGSNVIALDKTNLQVQAGQWVMLAGHNGSGKTSLLKIICGYQAPDSGEIYLSGKNIRKISNGEISRKVFYVHQDPLLGTAPTLTLLENLLIADEESAKAGNCRAELRDKYEELLRPLGLATRLKQLARTLSGGERQLLALLIARLRPAEMILLDEPLAALDPAKTNLCLELIGLLHRAGKTLIQVTHNKDLALKKGDRTIILSNGRVTYDAHGAERDQARIDQALEA